MSMNDTFTKFNWHNGNSKAAADSQRTSSPYNNKNNQQLMTPIFGTKRGSGSLKKPPKILQIMKPRVSEFGGMTL